MESLREWAVSVVVISGIGLIGPRSFSDHLCNKKAVDGHLLVPYDPRQHWKGGDSKIYEF